MRGMKKIICALSVFMLATGNLAANVVNPFFDGYENQVAFNFGFGVNSGFLLPPPTQFVPFNMMHVQYSQPTTFFRMPARQSLNIVQTLGHGSKYGWHWDKYTIPMAVLSEDISFWYGCDWYTFAGLGEDGTCGNPQTIDSVSEEKLQEWLSKHQLTHQQASRLVTQTQTCQEYS